MSPSIRTRGTAWSSSPGPYTSVALWAGWQLGRGFLTGGAIYKAVGEVSPHAPAESYCRMAWRSHPYEAYVTLERPRVNETTVVGHLTANHDFRLVIETHFPSALTGPVRVTFIWIRTTTPSSDHAIEQWRVEYNTCRPHSAVALDFYGSAGKPAVSLMNALGLGGLTFFGKKTQQIGKQSFPVRL